MTSQKLSSYFLAATLLASVAAGTAAQGQEVPIPPLPTPSTAPLILHFADGGDFPGRLTTDAAGNIYIATQLGSIANKSTFGVVKYSFSGKTEQTIRDVPAPGEFGGFARDVKVDTQGNLYVAGSSSLGGMIVSFNAAGKQRWSKPLDTQHTSFAALSVVLDADANVYVGGLSLQPGNGLNEWTVAKFSSTGKELWVQHHVGKMEGDNKLVDIALDSTGNVFAIGSTDNVGAFLKRDLTVVKYDMEGNEVFARDFTSTPHSDQTPAALAVDSAGNVYVTGITSPLGPEGDQTPVTLKYDGSGNLLFVLEGDGMGGLSIALDPAGNVLLSGTAVHTGPNPPIVTASKFTNEGKKLWITPVAAAGKIVSDTAGNAYVASSVIAAGASQSNYFITKLNPQGRRVLEFRFAPGNRPSDATVDPFGNLVVTGEGENAQFEQDIYTVRLPKNFSLPTVPPTSVE